jgi:hypothetical protein
VVRSEIDGILVYFSLATVRDPEDNNVLVTFSRKPLTVCRTCVPGPHSPNYAYAIADVVGNNVSEWDKEVDTKTLEDLDKYIVILGRCRIPFPNLVQVHDRNHEGHFGSPRQCYHWES